MYRLLKTFVGFKGLLSLIILNLILEPVHLYDCRLVGKEMKIMWSLYI